VARTVTFKEMNGLFASLIRHEYFADVRMLYRVICGCLSAATSANYPLQHPHIRISADHILPPAVPTSLHILVRPYTSPTVVYVNVDPSKLVVSDNTVFTLSYLFKQYSTAFSFYLFNY